MRHLLRGAEDSLSCGGIGGTLGSPIAGIAMDNFGHEGFTTILGLTFLALGTAAIFLPLNRLR